MSSSDRCNAVTDHWLDNVITMRCSLSPIYEPQKLFGETLDEIGYNDPAAVIREDALFAEYYFRAYDAYHSGKGSVPEAWLIAFSTAQSRSVSGSGNLILGFNAHIQRDLPFVLYELYLQDHPVKLL